eukprot:CAMPEP_0184684890 /NCGR_PEP_ID=MMETSP0312-20130426/17031_1 /TAXON_ID=31354 /ORGANISM="Compsopogon coeruleus, Strain SAG 36.94" /LENGTH=566 /DNA_ID=CAMNT_0027138507 /DNA_START=262 /DNA_END=1962 /DNA_ORIENTATION=-
MASPVAAVTAGTDTDDQLHQETILQRAVRMESMDPILDLSRVRHLGRSIYNVASKALSAVRRAIEDEADPNHLPALSSSSQNVPSIESSVQPLKSDVEIRLDHVEGETERMPDHTVGTQPELPVDEGGDSEVNENPHNDGPQRTREPLHAAEVRETGNMGKDVYRSRQSDFIPWNAPSEESRNGFHPFTTSNWHIDQVKSREPGFESMEHDSLNQYQLPHPSHVNFARVSDASVVRQHRWSPVANDHERFYPVRPSRDETFVGSAELLAPPHRKVRPASSIDQSHPRLESAYHLDPSHENSNAFETPSSHDCGDCATHHGAYLNRHQVGHFFEGYVDVDSKPTILRGHMPLYWAGERGSPCREELSTAAPRYLPPWSGIPAPSRSANALPRGSKRDREDSSQEIHLGSYSRDPMVEREAGSAGLERSPELTHERFQSKEVPVTTSATILQSAPRSSQVLRRGLGSVDTKGEHLADVLPTRGDMEHTTAMLEEAGLPNIGLEGPQESLKEPRASPDIGRQSALDRTDVTVPDLEVDSLKGGSSVEDARTQLRENFDESSESPFSYLS